MLIPYDPPIQIELPWLPSRDFADLVRHELRGMFAEMRTLGAPRFWGTGEPIFPINSGMDALTALYHHMVALADTAQSRPEDAGGFAQGLVELGALVAWCAQELGIPD